MSYFRAIGKEFLLAAFVLVASGGSSTAQSRSLASITTKESQETARGAQLLSYRMRNSNDVIMYLTGTTPVKNWKLTARGLQGDAMIQLDKEHRLSTIEALTFSLPVDSLKGEESAMEREAHKALKAEQYHAIIFTLKTASIDGDQTDHCIISAKGTLSVAGVVREVTLRMRSKVQPDGSVTFTGAQELKMSDYRVERPSLLFGMIKADDEMKLTYSLRFAH